MYAREGKEGPVATVLIGPLGGLEIWTRTAAVCFDVGKIDVDGDLYINKELGMQAKAIAHEDLQVAAPHLGGCY